MNELHDIMWTNTKNTGSATSRADISLNASHPKPCRVPNYIQNGERHITVIELGTTFHSTINTSYTRERNYNDIPTQDYYR